MSQIRGIKRGLSDVQVDFEETSEFSSYFNVFGWKGEYNRGFHTLTISGSRELKSGTYIRIELLDEGGRPIPINLPSSSNEYEEKYLPSRRFGFEINDDTLNGVATMVFVGTTENNKTVRYKRTLVINKNTQTEPLIERGTWEENNYYEANNVVQYQGSSYICILRHESSSSITPTNSAYWRIFAQGGSGTLITLTRSPIIIPFDENGDGLYGSNSTSRIYIRDGAENVTNEWNISASLTSGDATFSLNGEDLTVNSITEGSESEILITAEKDGDTLELQLSVLTVSSTAGKDSKLVKLNVDGQIFTYDSEGNPSPSGQTISFDVIRQNIDISEPTNWSIVDGDGNVVSNTILDNLDDYSADLSIANFSPYKKLTITTEVDGIIDRVSIYKLIEGSTGITVVLTNESHVLQSDPFGNVSDYSGAETEVWVFVGDQRVDQNADVTFDFRPSDANVIIDNTASDTDDGYLKIDQLNSDSGYVDIDVFFDASKVFEKRFSISKSIAGTDGINARTVDLSTSRQVFVYDSNGDIKDNTIETIVANAYNTDGTVYYEFLIDGTQVQNQTSNTYSYTPQNIYLNMPQLIRVNIREGSPTGDIVATDILTLYGVKEGSDSLYVVLSNEAHTVGVDEFDNIIYTGSGTDISVYEGSNKLNYDSSTPYGVPSFRVEVLTESGIQAGSASTINGNTRRFADAQNMTSGQASIVFNIIVTTSTGSEIEIERTQSFSQSNAGSSAKLLKIIADSQIIELDSEGNPVNSTITLEAFRQNYSTNDLEWYFDNNSSPSFSNTDTITINQNDFATNSKNLKVRLQNSSNTLFDIITLFIIKDGTQGITIVTSNENHTFPASSSGEVTTYDGSSSLIEIYYGSDLLSYNDTATQFSDLNDLEWYIDDITVTPTSSITPTFSANGQNASLSLSNFGDSYDRSSVVITIGIKSGSDERTFQKTFSYSKSKSGVNAKLISIEYDSQLFKKDQGGQITPSTITLIANLQNISSNVTWRNKDTNTQITGGVSGSNNEILEISPSDFGTETTLTIQAEADGFVAITTLAIIEDGIDGTNADDPYLALLSKYSITVPTQDDGSEISGVTFQNAVSTLTIYQGSTDVTNTFNISVGADTTLSSSQYSLVGDTVTISGMSDDTEVFVFSATKTGAPTIVQTFALSKSRRGQEGGEATGIILIFRGIYDSGVTYERTSTYADVVRYNNTSWVVSEGTNTVSSVEPTTSATEWTEIPTYENIATDILLAKDVTIRRSLTMGEQGNFGNVAGGIIRSLGGFDSSGNETINNTQIDRRYYQLTKDGIDVYKGTIGGFEIDDNRIKSTNDNIILNDDGTGTFSGTIIAGSGSIGGWSIQSDRICQEYANNEFLTLSTALTQDISSPIGLSLYRKSSVSGHENMRVLRIGQIHDKNQYTDFSDNEYGIVIGRGSYGNQDYEDIFRISSGGDFILISDQLTINNGSATFSGALSGASGSFSGSVTANSGNIGGWTIGAKSISNGSVGMYVDTELTRTDKGAPTTAFINKTGFYIDTNNYFLDDALVGPVLQVGNANSYIHARGAGALSSIEIKGNVKVDSGYIANVDVSGTLTMGANGKITNDNGDFDIDDNGLTFYATGSTIRPNAVNWYDSNLDEVATSISTYLTAGQDIMEFIGRSGKNFLMHLRANQYIIENLPTSPPSPLSGRLYTQTASQLGGSGSTKVLCIT